MINAALILTCKSNGIVGSAASLNYDGQSKLFYFNLSSDFFPTIDPDTGATVPALTQLDVTPPLAALLSGFPWTFQSPNFYLRIPDGYPIPTPGSGTSFYQDFNCTSNGLWTPIDSFCFITNLMPVVIEQGTAPTQIGESNVGTVNASTGLGFTAVLTDYNVSSYPEESLQSIEYVPSAEYRIGNLTGSAPVQTIDVQIFWRYRLTGDLVPVYLPGDSSVSLKMLLRRKGAT